MSKLESKTHAFQTTDREFVKHVNLSIQWNRWLLKPMGIWPQSRNISGIGRFFKWQINIICYSLISFLFIPCSLYVILEVEEFYDKLRLFGPMSFCVMAYLKYYSIISHENDIRECVERIEWDWTNITHLEDRNIMITKANFGKRLIKICAFFMYSGAVFYYVIVPMLSYLQVGKVKMEDENVTYIPITMPFPRQILDTRYSPTNEIIFSIQVLSGILIHAISAGACSLIAAFAIHACGQMNVLMCWLNHLIDGRPDLCTTVDGRIANIVNQHVRILEFLSLTEKALQQISFVEFTGCTLNLCLLGYYLIMEWNWNDLTVSATYAIILVSFLFNIFIFCYIGELVADLCKQVGETSYMVEWYRLKGKQRLSFVLIIAMSNLSTKLTAGNMVDLSLSTFGDVVKTSVAFLNMLRATT